MKHTPKDKFKNNMVHIKLETLHIHIHMYCIQVEAYITTWISHTIIPSAHTHTPLCSRADTRLCVNNINDMCLAGAGGCSGQYGRSC